MQNGGEGSACDCATATGQYPLINSTRPHHTSSDNDGTRPDHHTRIAEEQMHPISGSLLIIRQDSNEGVIEELGQGLVDTAATGVSQFFSFRRYDPDKENQSHIPGAREQDHGVTDVTSAVSTPAIQEQQSRGSEHAENGASSLQLDSGPSHAPSRGVQPHPPHGIPVGPQLDNPSAGSTINVCSMEVDGVECVRLPTTSLSPSNTPPNAPHPQNHGGGPASSGSSNYDRRQRNKSQDKILMDLGEGITRMNDNLEMLNTNLGALKDFVGSSRASRGKQKRRSAEAQPSDNDGTDADDEGTAAREYRPPKRKTQGQNTLHICPVHYLGYQ